MPTINDITSGSSYRGTKELGGAQGTPITIDPSPLGRLATFTYYANRDMWERKQKDDMMAANQIANIAAYDIYSPFKPYTDDLKSELDGLKSFIRTNPNSLNYSKDPKGYQELYDRIGKFEVKRKRATANDVLYNAQKTKVDLIADPLQKDLAKRELDVMADDLFVDGIESAYSRQFEATPEPKAIESIIPTVETTTRSTIVPLPNENITVDVTYSDLDDLRAKAVLAATGQTQVDITTQDWYKRLSPAKQAIALERSKIPMNQISSLNNTANTVNSVLSQFKAANPNVDFNTIDINSLPNNSVGNQIRSIRQINDSIDELNAYVLQGAIKDPSGKVRTTPYEKIDMNDGVSAAELIFLKSIQESKVPLVQKVSKNTQQTNNAIERQRLSLDWTRYNDTKKEDDLNANSVINEAIDYIKKGEKVTVTIDGKQKEVLRIGDPSTLLKFVTLDKQGKTTNPPDDGYYDPETDQFRLVYRSSGGYTTDAAGKRVPKVGVTETYSAPMDQRTWLKIIADRTVTGGSKAVVNDKVNKVLKQNKNSLYEMSKKGQEVELFVFNGQEGTYDQLVEAFGKDKTDAAIKKGTIKKKK